MAVALPRGVEAGIPALARGSCGALLHDTKPAKNNRLTGPRSSASCANALSENQGSAFRARELGSRTPVLCPAREEPRRLIPRCTLFSDIDSLILYAGIHLKVFAKRFPYAVYYKFDGAWSMSTSLPQEQESKTRRLLMRHAVRCGYMIRELRAGHLRPAQRVHAVVPSFQTRLEPR
jgi:hypothetical protein